MKLSKFVLEQLPVAEISLIKAGSGSTDCSGLVTTCTGTDGDTGPHDHD
jgi:hypothetical protein